MKKHYKYILLTGIISGMALKDPLFGPLFGIFTAAVVGIPFFIFVNWLVKLFIKGNAATIDLSALLLSVIVIIGGFWFLFQPPGWFVFRVMLGNPPPPSVQDVHSRWIYGLFDVPKYLKFEIDKADLDKVIAANKFESYTFDEYEKESFQQDKWLDLRNMDKIEVYRKMDNVRCEYLIYDSTNMRAYYILYSIS